MDKHRYAMTINPNVVKVTLEQLVPNKANFKDTRFRSYVNDFMERNMPGFPMGLLDTDSDIAYERWDVLPTPRYVVKTVQAKTYTCSECEELYTPSAYEDLENHVCCTPESTGTSGEEAIDIIMEENLQSYYVLVDTDYSDTSYVTDAGTDTFELDGQDIEGWDVDAWNESDAEDKADELNIENAQESGYGFPWAHSWCHLPEDFIDNEELQAAGFKVATYTGGAGTRNDDTFRLAGIDGGGYGFAEAHFAALVGIVAWRRNWIVQTDNGEAYIVEEDELLPMEQLAVTGEHKDASDS